MTARWGSLPAKARVAANQAPVTRRKKKSTAGTGGKGAWRCAGPRGCGEPVEGAFGAMERHLDAHGGGRAECVFEVRGKP